MTDQAREAARVAVPFHAMRGFGIIRESERRSGYALGFDAGVIEGIRRARAVAAPDFTSGSEYRRENYVRQKIVEDIDALEVPE